MRAALLIGWREVRERRAMLAAALVASLLPFLSPLLPGTEGADPVQVRLLMAGTLALGLGLILALVLGGTVIARDLSENRLGFDFARPAGSLSIWAGRLGAALALALGTLVVVALPASLAGDPPAALRALTWKAPLQLAAALMLCVGLAHVASVAVRSRSRWLALDLVGGVLVFVLIAVALRRLLAASAEETARGVALVLAGGTIAALWIASAVQVARGRTDLVRGHRAQSLALWTMLGSLALASFGYASWYRAVDVADLDRAWGRPAPRGTWVALAGSSRGRPELTARFLYDVASGRSIRLAPGWRTVTMFSEDGGRAVWLARSGQGPIETHYLDLASPETLPRRTTIDLLAANGITPDLSPSGRLLATLQGSNLAVQEVETGRILAAVRLELDSTSHVAVVFLDERRVRVYTRRDRIVAHDLDLDARARTSWTGPEVLTDLMPDARHERLLAESGPGQALLLNGSDGTVLGRLGVRTQHFPPPYAFLADGRIAAVTADPAGNASLALLSRDGEPLTSFDLGSASARHWFWVGPEPDAGEILLGRYVKESLQARPRLERLEIVSLTTGARRVVTGQDEMVGGFNWMAQRLPAVPGGVASRLLQGDSAVWLLDPSTATLRRVVGDRHQ